MGEYAVTSGAGNGNLMGALAGAAFLTGVERNADLVVMASYAPLFARLENKAWNPDLIYFNAATNVLTPSYHVQRLFARNRPDRQLPLTLTWEGLTPPGTISNRGAPSDWDLGTRRSNTGTWWCGRGEAVLYASAFDRGAPEWKVCRGDWSTLNGGYRQDARIVDCRSLTGETWWTNCTLSLRARKRGGQEGFLILFHWKDPDNWTWWNRGGCNNTQHAVEVCRNGVKSTLAPSVPGSIEIGRWCDIRVELEGTWIRCYLDDQLVHDVRYLEPGPIYGVAGWDETRRQVIVKLVNVTGETVPVDVSLEG
ncbi:alpha-L-arabinofuranosidase C-terminal domain-containing protein [Limisphaera sp. 4302-co]|uniref:alpha-L-arabinofuranosidase C-terminal domain-containing protein n=1 Tax=Limisphaera sp. 4302-co TaxID=3400417 RepID=UPI003C219D91